MAYCRQVIIGWLSRCIKDRPSIGVGDSLSERAPLIDDLSGEISDMESSVSFMRKDESRGNRSTRVDTWCTESERW